jgi:hypothetical protein
MIKLILFVLLVVGCHPTPIGPDGPLPTRDALCNHINNELHCPINTLNQQGCDAFYDNLVDTPQANLLNCFMSATSCRKLDDCDGN